MPLKLVFLGRLEDIAGEGERLVPTPVSFESLLDSLEPQLAKALLGDRIRLAVNGELVKDAGTAGFADGDELAFLPPVSGG